MSVIKRLHHVSGWRERKLNELHEIFRKLADKSLETVVLVGSYLWKEKRIVPPSEALGFKGTSYA